MNFSNLVIVVESALNPWQNFTWNLRNFPKVEDHQKGVFHFCKVHPVLKSSLSRVRNNFSPWIPQSSLRLLWFCLSRALESMKSLKVVPITYWGEWWIHMTTRKEFFCPLASNVHPPPKFWWSCLVVSYSDVPL
jgi:hypothetical protein